MIISEEELFSRFNWLLKNAIEFKGHIMDTQYINFFSVFIASFFLSALLGRKNPIIAATGFSIFLTITAFFINEIRVALIFYIALGLIACLSWSVFFRWLLLKDRMGQNDTKIKVLLGFSSGGSTRNAAIISRKSSREI
jgi:Na+/citrate or Na+/malate symporter